MVTKKKNDSDYKQLERQFNVLADCVDKLDNNNAREICDLQTRVRRLEDIKSDSEIDSASKKQADLEDRKFWRNCLGILLVSAGIVFLLQFAISILLSMLGLIS